MKTSEEDGEQRKNKEKKGGEESKLAKIWKSAWRIGFGLFPFSCLRRRSATRREAGIEGEKKERKERDWAV